MKKTVKIQIDLPEDLSLTLDWRLLSLRTKSGVVMSKADFIIDILTHSKYDKKYNSIIDFEAWRKAYVLPEGEYYKVIP